MASHVTQYLGNVRPASFPLPVTRGGALNMRGTGNLLTRNNFIAILYLKYIVH